MDLTVYKDQISQMKEVAKMSGQTLVSAKHDDSGFRDGAHILCFNTSDRV